MSGFYSVDMTNVSRSPIDGGSEERGGQLSFPSFPGFEADVSPHVRQDRDVPQRPIPAELPEHTKVSDINPCEFWVRNAMKVDDAREPDSRFVP